MKTKRYTIHVPVKEIWEMEVDATSQAEALRMVREGQAHQVCSFSGVTKSGRSEVVSEREISEQGDDIA